MKPMKAREQSVLDYVVKTIRENGYSPSVREIKEALGFKSTSNVQMYLDRLEERGLLRRETGKSRTITVDMESVDTLEGRIPILGRVAAGKLSFAEEDYDGYLESLADPRFADRELFALRIKGQSMRGVGIMDGDLIVVEKTDYAENGDIVVATVDGETTVKQYFKENGVFRLQPHNPDFEPIILTDVEIVGKVVADLRMY